MTTSESGLDMKIGYNKLAALFEDYDDLAMFRCFSDLSAKNLLYMQAEILRLAQKLGNQIEYDFKADRAYAEDIASFWRTLESSSEGEIGWQQKQIMLEIREKLKVYYEALLQTAQVKALAKPQTWAYEYLTEWFARALGGNNFLRGDEADAWRPEHMHDLVVLSHSPKERDRFAQFLIDGVLPLFHRRIGQKLKDRLLESKIHDTWEYKQKVFVVVGNVVCMVLSALVPSVSVFILCFLQSMIARLGVITAMSFIFSFIMTIVVQGRRVDVFAATTAFAAVQVVFLGGQNYVPGASTVQHDGVADS